jgi:hypothetical protein
MYLKFIWHDFNMCKNIDFHPPVKITHFRVTSVTLATKAINLMMKPTKSNQNFSST